MAANFYSMANHSAPAMFTNRRDRVDRTFKAVERASRTGAISSNALFVLITAYFVFRHLPPHFAKMTIKCPIHGRRTVLQQSALSVDPNRHELSFSCRRRKWPA
jgi:hypothetical protein